MTRKILHFIAAVLFAAVFVQMGFNAWHMHQNAVLSAQTPPIPTVIPVIGASQITSATSVSMISSPGTALRNYIYSVRCMNFVNSAAIMTIYTSSTTVASTKAYLNCPPSAQGVSYAELIFNPPLRLDLAANLVVATVTTTGVAQNIFANASGYTSR